MAFDPSTLGLPVELTQIPSQLKALWGNEEHRTRASLLNLVVYCQGTSSFTTNTELISRFVRSHACRAILLGDCPAAEAAPKVSAWIQAHCHLNKAGAQEICSEQITFLAEGISQTGIANLLMANLDYDLPLNLWWQGDLPAQPNSPLWQRVDRLIFDSLHWRDPSEALHRLTLIREQVGPRVTFADLNWTRTLSLRQAVAQCFDMPELQNELGKLNHLEIRHAPEARLGAMLLASWFAAQLGWMVVDHEPTAIHFRTPTGVSLTCSFLTGLSDSLSGLTIRSDHASLSLEREVGSTLFQSVVKTVTGTTTAHFAAGNDDLRSLLSEEMTPGTKHRVYLKALTILQVLIP